MNIEQEAKRLVEEYGEDELIELISTIDLRIGNFSFTDRLMAKLIDTIIEDVGISHAFDDMLRSKDKLKKIYDEGGMWR